MSASIGSGSLSVGSPGSVAGAPFAWGTVAPLAWGTVAPLAWGTLAMLAWVTKGLGWGAWGTSAYILTYCMYIFLHT